MNIYNLSEIFVQKVIGDDWIIPIEFTDAAGQELDLSGWISWEAKGVSDLGSPVLVTFVIDATDAASGVIILSVARQTTVLFKRTTSIIADLRGTNEAGKKQTVARLNINLLKSTNA